MSLAPAMYERLAPSRERIRVRVAPGSPVPETAKK